MFTFNWLVNILWCRSKSGILKPCFLQVKQLRNRADEDARLVHMSLQMDSELPSSLRKDLDHLMVLVSLFLTHLLKFSSVTITV